MRRSASLIAAILSVGLVTLGAHDVITTKITWSREISRLVYKRCASCHREKGSAFSLMSWEEARPWAAAIKEEVLARRMPPWGAVKGFGELRDDPSLTQEEMDLIANWVQGGAPEGEAMYLPPKPHFDRDAPTRALTKFASIPFDGDLTLYRQVELVAIRPKAAANGTSVQVYAVRPDGSAEPLIWLYRYQPSSERTFYMRRPLDLPGGTRIVASPRDGCRFTLFFSNGE